MKQNSKKPKMYYLKQQDRELIRDSDMGTEDSSDPMESDGYGQEEELAGEPDGPVHFSVPTKSDQKDDLPAPGKKIVTKLRKAGAPK